MQHMQKHQPMIKSGLQTVHTISIYTYRVLYFHDNTLFYLHPKRNFAQGYLLYCTQIEFQIVRKLLEHVDHVQSFATLFGHVTSTCDALDIRALRRHIFRIRRKLPPYFRLIGIPKQGYILRYEGPKPARRRKSASRENRAKQAMGTVPQRNLLSSRPVDRETQSGDFRR